MNKRGMDKILLFICLSLCVFGLIMVYSASFPFAERQLAGDYSIILRQIIYFIFGLVAMFFVYRVDTKFYRKYAFALWLGSLLFALLVFTPLGTNQGTFAKRWINLFITTIMPSDILKITGIIVMARFISQNNNIDDFKKGTLPAMVIIIITIFPILLQPDTSTAFMIALVLMSQFFVFGINLRHLIPTLIVGFGGMIIYIYNNSYRVDRILAMYDPLADYYESGWQLSQSLFAVSNGGLFGRGLGRSIQKFSNLTEAYNDFIFAVLAEEWGFIGSTIVILLFGALILRIIKISLNHPDRFQQIMGIGIGLSIGFQAIINIGVTIGIIPPTGVTLPFISYGGTSLIISMAMIGIVLRMSRDVNKIKEKNENIN